MLIIFGTQHPEEAWCEWL